jgi:prepilin-type N-terminal cleavage/methylation domain-containing protein
VLRVVRRLLGEVDMMPRSRTRTQRQAGFSLIELLIVVTVIVITAAVALPYIGSYIRNYKVRGAAQQVASEIQAARLRAINSNVRFGVVFVVLDATHYQVAREDLAVTPGGAGSLVARPTIDGTFLADTVQASPQRELPGMIEFATTCPGFVAAGALPGLRFSNLGRACAPAIADPACPPFATGTNLMMNVTDGTLPTFGMSLCLRERTSGTFRYVRVAPGGRVAEVPF